MSLLILEHGQSLRILDILGVLVLQIQELNMQFLHDLL